ncbi:hypothetical protein [Aliiroseovarius sp.]|uniref:hypothetical protein n=1 Tax=Aliiroseovarius sp. TaxID=1872442 RepID=UPI003BA84C1F
MRMVSLLWLPTSFALAATAGFSAFSDPARFSGVVDLLATVVSILIGVSLAVIAVLSSPFSVTDREAKDCDEAARMTKLVKQDDDAFADGQLLLFWVYLISLGLSLIFKWQISAEVVCFDAMGTKILASGAAFVGILAFCLSARLPLMLREISKQRRSLG